jgi:hypothetical protein
MSATLTNTFPFPCASGRVSARRVDLGRSGGRRWLVFALRVAYISLLLTWLAVTVL